MATEKVSVKGNAILSHKNLLFSPVLSFPAAVWGPLTNPPKNSPRNYAHLPLSPLLPSFHHFYFGTSNSSGGLSPSFCISPPFFWPLFVLSLFVLHYKTSGNELAISENKKLEVPVNKSKVFFSKLAEKAGMSGNTCFSPCLVPIMLWLPKFSVAHGISTEVCPPLICWKAIIAIDP